MTSEPVAGNEVAYTFTPSGAAYEQWFARSECQHGKASCTTYLYSAGILNPTGMVTTMKRNHDLVVGCNCPLVPPQQKASVNFQPANAVAAGEQRYIPQSGANLSGSNFRISGNGPLMCVIPGAYLVTGKVQLSRGLTQGAGGVGYVLLSGLPTLSSIMVDEASRATANLSGLLNLTTNQSVTLGYENTSKQVQDVQVSQLIASAVWIPPFPAAMTFPVESEPEAEPQA